MKTPTRKILVTAGGLLILSIIILAVFIGLSFSRPNTDITTANAFNLFARVTAPASIPETVRDLQANGAVWMDMLVLCRFQAPTNVINSILEKGYQRTTWNEVERAMHPRHYTDSFSPKWNPDSIAVKECYLQRIERDHGTDILYLVFDGRSGVVYAVAKGEVHN
jgi:hypothetical protein